MRARHPRSVALSRFHDRGSVEHLIECFVDPRHADHDSALHAVSVSALPQGKAANNAGSAPGAVQRRSERYQAVDTLSIRYAPDSTARRGGILACAPSSAGFAGYSGQRRPRRGLAEPLGGDRLALDAGSRLVGAAPLRVQNDLDGRVGRRQPEWRLASDVHGRSDWGVPAPHLHHKRGTLRDGGGHWR